MDQMRGTVTGVNLKFTSWSGYQMFSIDQGRPELMADAPGQVWIGDCVFYNLMMWSPRYGRLESERRAEIEDQIRRADFDRALEVWTAYSTNRAPGNFQLSPELEQSICSKDVKIKDIGIWHSYMKRVQGTSVITGLPLVPGRWVRDRIPDRGGLYREEDTIL
jgi:hypothetical protein